MTQIGKSPPPGDHSRQRENVIGALWALVLVVTGCLLLSSLSQNAQRDECLMRGAALCDNWHWAVRHTQAAAPQMGLADYIKESRNW